MALVNIPDGQSTVRVKVIDNGARIRGSLSLFLEPDILKDMSGSGPAFVFLVEHEKSGRRILFDLGIRKNFDEYTPFVREYHKMFQFEMGEEISDFLQDRGVALETIEAIVWRWANSRCLLYNVVTNRQSAIITLTTLGIQLDSHRRLI